MSLRELMQTIVAVFLLVLPAPSLADTLKVTRVIDGDTLKVTSESGLKSTIRLVGIDVLELGGWK
jgi:endonuclease YncB( thermonuclease family)